MSERRDPADATRHARVAAWFEEVCDLSGPELERRLADFEAEDDAAARELRAVLDADHDDAARLDGSALGAAGIDLEDLRAARPAAGLPERLGGYRVLGELGRGGMGVVLLAEQDRPRRTVALKLLRHGLLSDERVARFEREADLLGSLDHPGVARVFEVGTFQLDGEARAFIAMERVDGRPVTEWARATDAPLRARLEVLAELAETLEACHARGIVHRDLKAANVLVDAQGRPKVLDFGVARVDDGPATQVTTTGEIVGTLHAMSPEQARGDGTPVDARSDVYSLGVLAYELLCGRRPYATEGLAVHEAARVIAETEPALLGRRDPRLAGDVETIVAKALEKEPRRRYASAGELAADLRRHLDDLPIVARPMTRRYRAAKYVRRNRLAVGATAAVVLALALGLVGTATQARAARASARTAEERLARAVEVQRLVVNVFGSVDPELEGEDARVIDVIERSERYLDDPGSRSPLVIAALHHTIGRVYLGLGRQEDAVGHFQEAVRLRREHGEEAWMLAESLEALADTGTQLGELPGVDPRALLNEAMALRERYDGPDHPATLVSRIRLLRDEHSRTGAADTLDEMVAALERLAEVEPAGSNVLEAVRLRVASTLSEAGRPEEAERLQDQVLEETIAAVGEEHLRVAQAREQLSIQYLTTGRLDEARAQLEAALAIAEERLEPDHPDLVRMQRRLGEVLWTRGRPDLALPYLERYLARLRERDLEPGLLLVDALMGLGNAYLALGRVEDARALVEEAEDITTTSSDAAAKKRPSILEALGILASWDGDLERAYELQREANELRAEDPTVPPLERSSALYNEGTLLVRLGRNAESLGPLLEALAIEEELRGPTHPYTLQVSQDVGIALLNLDRNDEALEYFEGAPDRYRAIEGPEGDMVFRSSRQLGECLRRLGRLEESAAVVLAADPAARSPMQRAQRVLLLAHVREDQGDPDAALALLAPWAEDAELREEVPPPLLAMIDAEHARLAGE